ncbi:DUF4123 domain-containing protein [Pseudomonas sp. C11]|uniref:DUF4123 domain-containing protein n=1 Tax=Pseudomonas sp. C11 TaxID=3075550 RepID=UPI002B000B5A|nr:DUF4123 domain-containing protein [Pseudomonas sp. C11]
MSLWLMSLPENSQIKKTSENDWADSYFIIDQVIRPDALERLYQVSGRVTARRLFVGTDYAGLSDVGPVWIALNGCQEAGLLAATMCQESLAGIAVSTKCSEDSAVAQAQYLLTMYCDGYGESLCRYYDPRLWHALATTLKNTERLMGGWSEVLAPFITSEEEPKVAWLTYKNVKFQAALNEADFLAVGNETLLQHKRVRWYFWLIQNSKLLRYQLNPDILQISIDNLQLLVSCGIHESRHLRQVLPLLSDQNLAEDGEAMMVLRSNLSAAQKIKSLEK